MAKTNGLRLRFQMPRWMESRSELQDIIKEMEEFAKHNDCKISIDLEGSGPDRVRYTTTHKRIKGGVA